jgi:hypothetical protein
VWRIAAYHIVIPPEHEEAVEAAIAKSAGQEFLILVDGVGEAMVRDAIPRLLGKITHAEERERILFVSRARLDIRLIRFACNGSWKPAEIRGFELNIVAR